MGWGAGWDSATGMDCGCGFVAGVAGLAVGAGAGWGDNAWVIRVVAQCSLCAGAGFGVRFQLLTGGLHAKQHSQRTLRLAHHGIGLGAAFHGAGWRCVRFVGDAQALFPLLGGSDVEGGLVGLGGVGWLQRGDSGDGEMVAAGEVFGTVGEWRWQREAERVDEVVVHADRELVGEVSGA